MPEQDLNTGLHSPIQCQPKPSLNTANSYAEARNAGDLCPHFTAPKGFPGRCAINTETSAVKDLRVRRQRLSESPVPRVAAVFVLLMAGRSKQNLDSICHPRAQSVATVVCASSVGGVVKGHLCVPGWPNGFNKMADTAVADKHHPPCHFLSSIGHSCVAVAR